MICSCAPIFKIFYTPPDGASTEYQISNREFSDFLHTYYCDFLNNVEGSVFSCDNGQSDAHPAGIALTRSSHYRQDLPEGQLCRYFVYSRVDFGVFRPAGATRCTDQRSAPPCQIWPWSVQGRGFTAPKTEKNRILPIYLSLRSGSLARFLQNL